MKTVKDLQKEFETYSGLPVTNEQGEPDIDYIYYLEQRAIELESKLTAIREALMTDEEMNRYHSNTTPEYANGYYDGAEKQRNRIQKILDE